MYSSWKKNIVDDPEAPQYYSQRAIWIFSIAFTVIFGAVLFASNLRDKKAKWTIIGLAVLYTIVEIIILNLLPRNTGLTFGANAGGAIILTGIFWKKYIGNETKFRAKAIWKPLIISILIIILFIAAIIYAGSE